MTVKSAWDNDSLYFSFDVKDRLQNVAKKGSQVWESDGVEIYLDINNRNSVTISDGMRKILVNIAGETVIDVSEKKEWKKWESSVKHTIEKASDKYIIKVSIPWNDLGGMPKSPFGVHFKLHNNDGSTDKIIHEDLSDGNPDNPRTWLKCTLTGGDESMIKQIHDKSLKIYPTILKQGEPLHIELPCEIANILQLQVVNVLGELFYTIKNINREFVVSNLSFSGIGIVMLKTKTGEEFRAKFIMN